MTRPKRPYMAIYTRYLPKGDADTRQKGWAKDGLKSVEKFEVHDALSRKIERDATVVIDLFDLKVVKNSTGLDRETVMLHYGKKYSEEIGQIIETWLSTNVGEIDAKK